MNAQLSFDGFGINDTNDYRTRLATFAQSVPDDRRKELARLWIAAPELLTACQAAASYFFRSRQSHAPEAEILLHAIRSARAPERKDIAS
jgi:hypothetical protein